MSKLDDLVNKYGSSSSAHAKKKSTKTTGVEGLMNKLGYEPSYTMQNTSYNPYTPAVDDLYNQVYNTNILKSDVDRRQLSAREKYAQREDTLSRPSGTELTLPQTKTVAPDTSKIGELEDSLMEEKKRTGYTSAQQAERARRESEYQDYANLQKLNNLLADDNQNWFTNGLNYDEVKKQRDELKFKVESSSLQDKQEAWNRDYQKRMTAAMSAADFAEKSKPDYSSLDPTYLQINEGKMNKDDISGYVSTYLSPELQDKDAWLEALDVSDGVKARIKAEAKRRETEKVYDYDYDYKPTDKSNSGEGTERYEYLTRDEKKVYNYLHSQSTEAADEFLDFLWDTLGERLAAAEQEEIEDLTKKLPGVSDIVSVPLNLAGGVTGLADLAKQTVNHWLTGAPIDTNSAAMRAARYGQDIRNVRSQQLANLAPNANVLGVNVLSALYSTAMSGLDSAAAGYIGKGISTAVNSARPIEQQIARELISGGTDRLAAGITEAILSGTAATQAAKDVKARGGNDNQVLLGALSAGIFEALFENMSIETLPAFAQTPWKSWRSAASTMAKFFITNASEEFNTELANVLFDSFTMGSVSEYATSVRKYMAEGMSYADAKKAVVKDFAVRVGESAASGGIMGAGFGISAAIRGRSAARQTGHALQTSADRSAFTALLADGLKADKGSAFGKLAQEIKAKIDAGQDVSDLDVGRLYNLAAEREPEETSPYNDFERAAADLQMQAGREEIEASKWANIGDELAANAFREEAQQSRDESNVMKQFGLKLPTTQSQAQQDFLARREANDLARRIENGESLYTAAEREANREAARTAEFRNDLQSNVEARILEEENGQQATPEAQGNAAEANAEAVKVTPRKLQLPTVKESNNGREVYLRDSGQRADSTNPGEQVRAVEESAGRNPRRQTLGLARDGESSNLTYERKAVSTKELTGSGSDNATIYRVTDGNTQYTRKASEMAKAANMKAVFFGGDNLRIGDVSARGMIDGDTIYIRVDHPQFTADQLMGHELGHKLIREGKVDVGAIRDKIAELVGQRSSDWLLGEYRQRYNGIKDSTQRVAQAYADAYEGAGMTDAEIWEEMVCDALGDMNAFAGDRTMTDSTRGIVDQYLAEIKNQAEAQQTRAPPGELSQDVINDIQHDRPIDTADEVKASREFDSKYQEKAEKKNKSLGFVAEDIMVKAGKQRAQVKEWLDAIADKLPPDVLGNTWITDQSYGGTEELTTVCIRSIGAHMLMDAIADKLGRPLNVIETTRISQAIFDYTDKPECLYCYVAMDRKAYREFLGSYIEQRDAFIKDIKDGKPAGIKSGKVDADSAYGRFLGNRKNTSNMQDRAKLWLNTYNSGAEFITAKDLANTENLMAAAERNSNAEKQVIDATAYAQSASWAKKQISYAAYNNHVLRWSQKAIDKLNSHYGMRFYSFSDYSPAFLLENMQMVTDAAVRGLKGLGYTKEIDFAKAFAPTGMNINCSVFAYKDKATGEYLCDGMQGADWEEVKALRKKYPNVGAVLVATDDAQVEWALEQDWIDVIIPFHMVRTGSVVANYFGWKNYTAMSRDVANDKNAEVKSITPPMHQNNKELYLAKCKEYNLTPRFKQWVDHPNYMRLVNETRQSEGETSPMQPIFDLTGAKASIDAMVKQGGYAPPIGGSLENMLDIADEMAGKIKEGKPLGKLEEARESSVKYSREFTPTAEDTAYLNAVNSGDMKTAQKMVDEAAEKAGYDISAYHATSNDFTVYDRSKLGENTDGNASSDLLAATAHVGHWFNSRDISSRIGASKALQQKLKMESPLRLESIDALTAWIEDNVPTDGTPTEIGDEAAAELRAQGYDGIILSDEEFGGTSFVVLDSNQVKSADPVTYDDSGNVIPLSERFNEKNEDIRYSREFGEESPVSQSISSAKTSIKQIPALFNNKNVEFGKTNIDVGGGRFDLATDYLKSIGTKNLVFDPYNRSEEVNAATLKYLQDGNKADTATCANVLNVIKEAAARKNVILETAKAIKDDGKAYFMVYEGDGSGVGRETSAGWQNNRKTADYVDEIGEYFDSVERKGKLIIASDPKENLPKAAWETTPGKATMFSREFDADLFDVNEDIRKRIASPKASGNGLAWRGNPATAKADIGKIAEQIVSTYSSTLKAADIAKELASINDSIKALRKNMTVSEFEKLQDTTDELAKKILANALAKETGVKAELQDEPAGLNEYSYYQKKAISLITADVLDSLLGGGQAVSAQNKKAAAQNIKLNNIRKAANEIMTSKQILADYVDQYGAIKKGEKASRDVQMPNKTGKDKKLSLTVRTILEAKATPDTLVPDIEYLAATGDFSYTQYSDKAAIQKAEETIKDKGWERALKDWLVDVNQKGEVSKTNTAIGWALYNAAANAGDAEAAIDILDALVKHQRNAAQTVQATRILKQLSPDAQLYGVARSVQNLQDDINEKYGEAKAPKLKIDEDLAQKFLDATTEEERTRILQDIYRDIGRQMPTKFADRWNAWRYLAMLGNPRTHVRNIVGNLGFTPVVMAKNLTATAIESAVDFVSGGRLNRTKGNIIGRRGGADILKAAWSDYDNVAEAALGGGKYSDFANANKYIEEGRRIFGKTKLKAWNKTGGRALEAYRKASGYALDKEDVWFSKPHYALAFAQYAQANGITADQIRSGKGLEGAREYALKEAQKATYRDTNAFSQAVSRLGRGNKSSQNAFEKGISTLAEGILPFRKTPANILARGVEYSPLGLLKSLTYDIAKVKQGKMTGAEMIDNLSAGLTGTGLLALGLFLAAQGLVRGHGSDDDKEKAFADLMGHQAYSLELPGGRSITLDWLAPESLPFFIGVNLYEMTQGGKKDVTLATLLEAVGYATEPMLEMSCLKSLNDIFDAVGYAKEGDMNALTSTIVSAATSYLTQGLPTLLGQLERTIENKRMTTYTEKNKFLTGDLQYTLGKASARVPGVDYEQIPYIDAWGREDLTGAALSRAFNNFLNPSFVSKVDESAMEKELERLYKATGDSSVFPQRAKKYFNVDGERKDLTGEEYVTYATAKGQTAYQMLGAITASDEYKKLDNEQKIKVIESVYTYADQTAKTLVGGVVTDSTTQKALFLKDYNVPPESYVFFKTVVATQFDEDDNGSISQAELEKAIDAVSGRNPKGLSLPSDKSTTVLTNAQKAALWQTYNKAWSAKNNPYDTTIGKEIYAKMHDGAQEKEETATNSTATTTPAKTSAEAKDEKPKEETINASNSSMFSAVSYNSGTLNLTFRSTKRTYSYENVPESVWKDMQKADSLGNFYNSRIKGKYSAA